MAVGGRSLWALGGRAHRWVLVAAGDGPYMALVIIFPLTGFKVGMVVLSATAGFQWHLVAGPYGP